MNGETPQEANSKKTEVLAGAEPLPLPTDNVLPPSTILQSRFEIVSLLGQGGMSTVYRAKDKVLGRTIALKVLQASPRMDANRLQRFQREARSTAKLDHPGIIKVFDFYFQEEPHCIAMELVEGMTLADYISGTIEPDTNFILDTFIAIADALGYAHKEGVIHRDIKPSNIMLLPGAVHPVKVMDFGIAKGLDDALGTKSHLTQTGEMIGSPLYMSPEQITTKRVDQRSDIYSFGCALYESLTRTPPFVANSAVETMMKHLNEAPLPLTTASLGKDYPEGLEGILMRMLAKNPDHRFQSFEQVHEALRPIASRPLATQGRQSKSDNGSEQNAGQRSTLIPITLGILLIVVLLSYSIFKTVAERSKVTIPATKTDSDSILPTYVAIKSTVGADLRMRNPKPHLLTDAEVRTATRNNDEDLNDQRLIRELVGIPTEKTSYTFQDYTFSNAGLEPLKARTGMKELILNGSKLSAKTLEPLKKMKLEALRLDETTFDDAMSSVLKPMTSLTTLYMSRDNITDAAMSNLEGLKLEKLVLKGTPIGDHAIRILSTQPLRKTLRHLNIMATNIDDDVFPLLQNFPKLEKLHISRDRISAEAMKKAKYPPHLNILFADMPTPLTQADQKEIKKQLPNGCSLEIHEIDI